MGLDIRLAKDAGVILSFDVHMSDYDNVVGIVLKMEREDMETCKEGVLQMYHKEAKQLYSVLGDALSHSTPVRTPSGQPSPSTDH